MPSSPTRLLAALLACAALPNLLPAADLLNGVPVEVLARSIIELPDRSVTYIRIRPPAFPAPPAPPPPPAAAEPSAEEVATALRREAKPYVQLQIGATVYAGSPAVTELSWNMEDGRRFRAFSSVDFTHLTQLSELETETTVYAWFPFVSDGDPAELPAGVREALAANGAEPQYLFEGTEADAAANESTLQALDYLHAFFSLNKTALIAATAQRQAEAAERERQAAEAPPKPKDTTIYFWKNETLTPTP